MRALTIYTKLFANIGFICLARFIALEFFKYEIDIVLMVAVSALFETYYIKEYKR